VIATPVSTHYELACQALRAGKHVLVEKPLAATTVQGETLHKLASRYNRILMVGHTFEYHPAVLKVAELLKAGELGGLYYIDSVRVNLGLYQSDGLNVIWDLAPHDISIILCWMNRVPRRVSAWGQAFVHKGIEDVAFIRLEFPDGVLAHIHISWLAPTKIRRITVVGGKKMVIYDDLENVEKIKIADRRAQLDPASRELRVGYRMGDIVSPRIDVTEPLSRECLHFIDCIFKNRSPQTDGQRGIDVVRVLEAADQSIKKGGAMVIL
jgi:predicted dehydrogenase